MPAGLDRLVRRRCNRPPDSGYATGGTYNYYHVLLNDNGTIDDSTRASTRPSSRAASPRRLVTKYHRSAKPFFLYFAPVAPHFGAPREKDDPAACIWPGTGSPEQFKTPARPTRVRGTFDRQITRASGLPARRRRPSETDVSGKPRPMRWLPEPIGRGAGRRSVR